MSTARPTPGHGGRQKREEEQSFMTLPEKEIAGCITDIGIPFSVQDLQKPNPQQIQRIFEWFAELLMNTNRDVVSPAMRAAAEDLCGQYSDVFTPDTRDLMGYFITLRRLLQECGITDFTFQDLYKPTRERLVRIFSYIINFIRFRESQTPVIDEHYNKSEVTKQRIETLYHSNHAKEDTLDDLERNRKSAEAALQAKQNRSKELESLLRGLKADQERVIDRLERVKAEQGRLKGVLEDKTTQTMSARQAAAKLRPYTEQSPEALEMSLQQLSDNLSTDKAQIETLNRRSRALQTSCEAFSSVQNEVKMCTSLLNELSRDLAAEEATTQAATRNQEALSERSNNVRDVEREEKMLLKQLENVQKRTEKLRGSAEERSAAQGRKMEELKAVNGDIKRERAERGREMEKRRVRIEQTEKKMADLKENIENEIHSAHDEFVRMDSHITLYIKEMEQSCC
ncbi:MAG: kinetochore-associated Ndc80 complex subunit nuf2 [Chrysothrix sp. TS-e1954]|nr:MAG: kinetochore-associated Ndc80 complex subunit nuf2 [Chrysothrix sp. TS-e1954]